MSLKLSLIPLTVALLSTSLPAFAQEDPRNWENKLSNAIYYDSQRGLTTPQQAQNRLNELEQIKEEHQQFLNQNGAPTGNVLSQAQRNLIRQQIDQLNQERENDTLAFRKHTPFYNRANTLHRDFNEAHYVNDPRHVIESHNDSRHFEHQPPPPAHPPIPQQGSQDYHGNWGYRHHWGD